MSKNPSFSHAISLSHYSVSTKWGHREKKNGRNCFSPSTQGWWIQEGREPRRNGAISKFNGICERSAFCQSTDGGSFELRQFVWVPVPRQANIQRVELFSKRGFWQLRREKHLKAIWVCLESGDPHLLQHNLAQGTRQPSPWPFIPTTGTHLLKGGPVADQDIWH